MNRVIALLLSGLVAACSGDASGNAAGQGAAGGAAATTEARAPARSIRVVNSYPHDHQAWTQGLVFHNGFLYESTGMEGQSSLRKVNLATGEVLQKHMLDDDMFGEGMTILGNRIYQLTWKSERGFIYDLDTFRPLREFTYSGEGWGLTNDGTHLIMSNGSSWLTFLDPETFAEVRRVEVRDGNRAVTSVNELQYINGEIYANVWLTDNIVRIDPASGNVLGWLDLSGILSAGERRRYQNLDVLNGIAYDSVGNRMFVTGKNWPLLFEVAVDPVE